jgi:hypothetical protein
MESKLKIVQKPTKIKKLINEVAKIKLIQKAITEIPGHQNLKFDEDFLIYVIQLVEELFAKNSVKRSRIVEIITSTISHSQEEILKLHNKIDELYTDKKIKKVSYYRRVKYFILSNFFLW